MCYVLLVLWMTHTSHNEVGGRESSTTLCFVDIASISRKWQLTNYDGVGGKAAVYDYRFVCKEMRFYFNLLLTFLATKATMWRPVCNTVEHTCQFILAFVGRRRQSRWSRDRQPDRRTTQPQLPALQQPNTYIRVTLILFCICKNIQLFKKQ